MTILQSGKHVVMVSNNFDITNNAPTMRHSHVFTQNIAFTLTNKSVCSNCSYLAECSSEAILSCI